MNQEKYGYIYKTTNIINGRKYIGQHKKQELDLYYKGSNKKLIEDIKKIGRDNFRVEILEWCYSKEQLDEREKFWIGYFNAEEDPEYYNIYGGGYPDHIPQQTKDILSKKKLELNIKKGKSFWVNNGIEEFLICSAQLEEFQKNGYVKGRLPDTIYVHKDNKSIRIRQKDLYEYMKNGYLQGKDDNIRKNLRTGQLHYIWYFDDLAFEDCNQVTWYLREHGYPKIAFSTVTGIARGLTFEKYSELSGRIRKIHKD